MLLLSRLMTSNANLFPPPFEVQNIFDNLFYWNIFWHSFLLKYFFDILFYWNAALVSFYMTLSRAIALHGSAIWLKSSFSSHVVTWSFYFHISSILWSQNFLGNELGFLTKLVICLDLFIESSILVQIFNIF